MIAFLLDHGADVERVLSNKSALLLAVECYNPDKGNFALEALVDRGRMGGDVNRIFTGSSLLHHAFECSFLLLSKRKLNILLSSPALTRETINFRQRYSGRTVLVDVMSRMSSPTLGPWYKSTLNDEILTITAATLHSFGADPDIAEGINHRTPLYYAVRNANVKMVKNLLEMGADVSKGNPRGVNPVQAAVEAMEVCEGQDRPRYREIISILREAGGRGRSRRGL
jgi:hypothetical protein